LNGLFSPQTRRAEAAPESGLSAQRPKGPKKNDSEPGVLGPWRDQISFFKSAGYQNSRGERSFSDLKLYDGCGFSKIEIGICFPAVNYPDRS